MTKVTPIKTIKPESMNVGQTIEIHASRLASFKTYVSRAKKADENIKFDYGDFIGSFCPVTRIA